MSTTVIAAPGLATEIGDAIIASGILDGLTVQLKISRPRKGSVGLTTEPGGRKVTLHIAPDQTPEGVIAGLGRTRDTLEKHLARARDCAPENPVKQLVRGEGYSYLGTRIRLDTDNRPGVPVELVHSWLRVPAEDLVAHGAKPVIGWYGEVGSRWASNYAGSTWRRIGGSAPMPVVRVGDIGRKRWAKYSPATHTVTLNWRLFQVSHRLVRYVLVHELAHATKPAGRRHGPEFWAVVRSVLPEYAKLKADLAEEGRYVWMGDVQAGAGQ